MAAGTMPAAMISVTALTASPTVLNVARMVRKSCGFGVRRTQILVTMASVPSLPQSRPARSSEAGSGTGPSCRTSPPASDDLQAEDVFNGHTVAERVRSAGVRGDVAADRGRALAGGVGCK